MLRCQGPEPAILLSAYSISRRITDNGLNLICLQQRTVEVLSNVVDGKRAHPTNSGCLLHLAVDEWDTLDDLGDELVAVESVPVFLRIGGQFEDHAKGGYA